MAATRQKSLEMRAEAGEHVWRCLTEEFWLHPLVFCPSCAWLCHYIIRRVACFWMELPVKKKKNKKEEEGRKRPSHVHITLFGLRQNQGFDIHMFFIFYQRGFYFEVKWFFFFIWFFILCLVIVFSLIFFKNFDNKKSFCKIFFTKNLQLCFAKKLGGSGGVGSAGV